MKKNSRISDDNSTMDKHGRVFRKSGDDTWESHPSYATAVFSRMQGNPGRLFGSQLTDHGSFIGLTISSAEVSHHFGKDCILPDKARIEVFFSAAQFATLLTTMNVGEGTACTLKYLDGKNMPPVPEDEKIESEKCYDAFKTQQTKFAVRLDEDMVELVDILDNKPTIAKKDRQKIRELLDKIRIHVHSNTPFALKNFQDAVEKTTQAAKAEIDSMVTTVIQKAGLGALKEKGANAVTKLLEGGLGDE